MENITLKLRGMSCASCASNVENAILSVTGVSNCNVNFAVEQATVNYDPKQTNIEDIQKAVSEAGYGATPAQDHVYTEEEDPEKNTRQAENRDLTHKLWTSGIISVILVIGSLPAMTGVNIPFIPMWLHHPWLQLILTTPVLFWAGGSFFVNAVE